MNQITIDPGLFLIVKPGKLVLVSTIDYDDIKKYNWQWTGENVVRDRINGDPLYPIQINLGVVILQRMDKIGLPKFINGNALDCRRTNINGISHPLRNST